jgi:diacylglycerol kinase family enzyme
MSEATPDSTAAERLRRSATKERGALRSAPRSSSGRAAPLEKVRGSTTGGKARAATPGHPVSDAAQQQPEILVNPGAGRRRSAIRARLERMLASAAVPARVRWVRPKLLLAEVDRLVARGAQVVGVAGGDGSIATAAGRLAGTAVALLPVPTGTYNHFSRRLGIDRLEDAVAALRGGQTTIVPIAVMDDRIFLNTATFGLYADVVRRRERLRPLLPKRLAATVAFFSVLLGLKRLDVVMLVDGVYRRHSTPLLWVGLGWGSFPRILQAREKRRSPDLEIVILNARTRVQAMRLLARLARHLLRGERPIHDPALEIVHARHLLVHSPSPIGVTLDGEPYRCTAPIFVAVLDDCLHVRVPGPS